MPEFKSSKCNNCGGRLFDEYGPYADELSAAWRRAHTKGTCWVCARLKATVEKEAKEDSVLA